MSTTQKPKGSNLENLALPTTVKPVALPTELLEHLIIST